jgi:hypothetical protein
VLAAVLLPDAGLHAGWCWFRIRGHNLNLNAFVNAIIGRGGVIGRRLASLRDLRTRKHLKNGRVDSLGKHHVAKWSGRQGGWMLDRERVDPSARSAQRLHAVEHPVSHALDAPLQARVRVCAELHGSRCACGARIAVRGNVASKAGDVHDPLPRREPHQHGCGLLGRCHRADDHGIVCGLGRSGRR